MLCVVHARNIISNAPSCRGAKRDHKQEGKSSKRLKFLKDLDLLKNLFLSRVSFHCPLDRLLTHHNPKTTRIKQTQINRSETIISENDLRLWSFAIAHSERYVSTEKYGQEAIHSNRVEFAETETISIVCLFCHGSSHRQTSHSANHNG